MIVVRTNLENLTICLEIEKNQTVRNFQIRCQLKVNTIFGSQNL